MTLSLSKLFLVWVKALFKVKKKKTSLQKRQINFTVEIVSNALNIFFFVVLIQSFLNVWTLVNI